MRPLIVANWKMNPLTLAEAKLLFNSVKKGIKNIKNVEVVICPPFVWLPLLIKKPSRQGVNLGAQDCFWAKSGAFTGEVSPEMLKNLGVEYVIIGHSERRKYFQETDGMINKKIKAVLSAKLKVIFCFGETWGERKLGRTKSIIKSQIKNGLKNLPEARPPSNLILAYEPVWAIGTGKPCGVLEAKAVNLFLRKMVKTLPIIYGGSVDSKNARDYIEKAGFQGLLVGGVSLNPKEFIKLVKNVALT